MQEASQHEECVMATLHRVRCWRAVVAANRVVVLFEMLVLACLRNLIKFIERVRCQSMRD